jgi:hypothetical protein
MGGPGPITQPTKPTNPGTPADPNAAGLMPMRRLTNRSTTTRSAICWA